MSNLIKAMMETLFFFALAALVVDQGHAASTSHNVTATEVALYGLVTIVFFLGGVWSIAACFGMVEDPLTYARSRARRHG